VGSLLAAAGHRNGLGLGRERGLDGFRAPGAGIDTWRSKCTARAGMDAISQTDRTSKLIGALFYTATFGLLAALVATSF
jgi:hypothetical protein